MMGTGPDEDKFAERAFTDMGAALTTPLCSLGDQYGLFKELAKRGALTPEELAAATNTNVRYVEEWSRALTCAGYLPHDPGNGRFSLPAGHVPVLAEEGGEAFLGGFYQVMAAIVRQYEGVSKAFTEGGGVPAEEFHEDLWVGEERSNSIWHENLLVDDWIPRLPEVKSKLESGAEVLDVGCGAGRALINIAKTFSHSRFTGIDILPANIERARAYAEAEGVSDRVSFEVRDITDEIPGKYDIVTAFDVVHDVQDPPKLLRDVCRSLLPGGRFMIMELNVADNLEDNLGPIGTLLYGLSPFYCMTISLAREGLGYGTAGLPPGRLKALADEAGFKEFHRVDVNSPIQVLYDLVA